MATADQWQNEIGHLRLKISRKVLCERVKFSNSGFCNISVTMNGHTYKLFKNILNDIQTKGKGEVNTA